LRRIITIDARCTREIKSRISTAKAAFNERRHFCTCKLGLNIRKILEKCYIWSIALYGAENWPFQKVDQKYLESFEMWCWRRMEISWTDHVRNELLQRVKEEINILQKLKRRNASWFGHTFHGHCILKQVIKGKIEERI
jgi:hypothetical protein